MTTINLNYSDVQDFAIAYCRIRRSVKGSKFATQSELEHIESDIWGWPTLWFPALVDALGTGWSHTQFQLRVDHNKAEVSISRD